MERLKPSDPEQIGPWQLMNRLGSGGMGIVYLGTNGTRSAAIKVIREHLLDDPTSRTRLEREVEALHKVRSDHVAEIEGSDLKKTPAWIATRFIDGPSLKTLVENEGPLKGKQWEDFAIGFMSALASVHSVGVIHRDIKPSNILMSKDGPKLIDFGISFVNDSTSLTRTGMVAGTPSWLAPEQFLGKPITVAVDDFAAGSTLIYAATGKTPWGEDENSSVAAVMRSILDTAPNTKNLTEIQESIILPLLRKEVSERATSAQTVKALNELTKSLGAPVHKKQAAPSQPKVVAPKAEPNKKKLATVLPIVAVLLAGGIYGATQLTGSGDSPAAKPSKTATPITAAKQYSWTSQLDGDTEKTTGAGKSFKVFVCDQGVIASSLVVKSSLSNSTATVKLFPNDQRCGQGFDTIEVNGPTPENATENLAISGKTLSGFKIDYPLKVIGTYK